MANDRVLEKQASYITSADSESVPRHIAITGIEIKETADQVKNAIRNLPKSSQVIVTMRIQDGKTFQAIADDLKLPIGTVLTRMRRAMEKIRRELEDHPPE